MIIRVFEGGLGSISGGRFDRFKDSGDFVEEPLEALERCGEGISVGIILLQTYGSSTECLW